MARPAAWILCLALLTAPLAAWAGDRTPVPETRDTAAELIRDYVAGISEAFDQNPHSCYEPDAEEERPDLASRPQS
jgi:hypothetical protein